MRDGTGLRRGANRYIVKSRPPSETEDSHSQQIVPGMSIHAHGQNRRGVLFGSREGAQNFQKYPKNRPKIRRGGGPLSEPRGMSQNSLSRPLSKIPDF